MHKAMRNGPATVLRALGSLLPGRRRARRGGRVLEDWRNDWARTYPSAGLTPSKALALLQAADGGSPQQQYEMFSEMLQKWPRLAAVESTRRLALTGLDWEIVPAGDGRATLGSEVADADAAAGADYCREALSGLERFNDVLAHLAGAIGTGLAVAELVWEHGQLVDIVPAPAARLVTDPHAPWRLCVLTEEHPSRGVPLDAQPHKWIIHAPRATSGRWFDGGLLRACVLLYLAQSEGLKDWLSCSEISGTPMRIAQVEPGTTADEKRRVLQMLEALGTEAVALFSKSVDLKFLESQRGVGPFRDLLEYCNTEVTILWLGQHLTTDLRQSGSRAAAEIHDRVREDLLVSDIAAEGATLRRDVLTPLVRARFGEAMPVPRFRRALIESVDTRVLAETLAIAVNELGLRAPAAWVHRALGVPQPRGGEETLPGGRGQ